MGGSNQQTLVVFATFGAISGYTEWLVLRRPSAVEPFMYI